MVEIIYNYWKQGSVKDADRIKAAFSKLIDDKVYPLGGTYDNEETLYLFDGETKRISVVDFNSSIAVAIMDSHHFNELPLEPIKSEPKFKVGDLVVWLKLLGRVEEIFEKNGIEGYFYTVGGKTDIPESELTKADHRDEIRILKGGAK